VPPPTTTEERFRPFAASGPMFAMSTSLSQLTVMNFSVGMPLRFISLTATTFIGPTPQCTTQSGW